MSTWRRENRQRRLADIVDDRASERVSVGRAMDVGSDRIPTVSIADGIKGARVDLFGGGNGIRKRCWHLGQAIWWPALLFLALNTDLQCGQEKRIMVLALRRGRLADSSGRSAQP